MNLAYNIKEIGAELNEKKIIYWSDSKCDQNGAVPTNMQTAITAVCISIIFLIRH
jgi:hypothetical protein